jgi:O-antigen/teichoic acid export membrane protein
LLRKKPGMGKELRGHVVRFGLTSWSADVIGGLSYSRSLIAFIERYVGIRAVGLFSVAYSVTVMATELPSLLLSALLPYLSEQHGLDARPQMQRVHRAITGIVALLVVPACVGAAAIAPVLVPLLFGAEFADAAPIAMVMLIPAAVDVVAASTTSLIYSTGKSLIMLISNMVGLVGTILLALLLIPPLGLMGAALSRAVAHVVAIGIQIWYANAKLGFSLPYRALGAITVGAVVQGLVAYGVIIGVGGLLSLVLAIPAAMAIYVLALRVMAVLPMLEPQLLDIAVTQAPRTIRRPLFRIIRLISPGSTGRCPHS